MLTRVLTFGLLGSLLLAACAAASRAASPPAMAPPAITVLPLSTETPVPTPTATPAGPQPLVSPTAAASPTPAASLATSYILHVRYDALNQRLIVVEEGRYTNTTGHPIQKLPLVAPAFTRAFISIQKLLVENQPAAYGWDWEHWTIWIPLTRPLEPEATLDFRLTYVLTLRMLRTRPEDNTHPMVLGYSPLQTNGVEIFFFVPHYDSHRGWSLPRYWPFGEFITYPAADYTLYLDVPPGWTVAANGEPMPCPEEAKKADVCYHLPRGRGLAFSTSTVYKRFTRRVPSRRGTSVQLEAYLFQGDAARGEYVLEVMARALHLYEHWFGPYHRSRLVFVVGDFPFSMEYDGLFFVRRSFFFDEPEYRLTAITVHETAHQWWYAQVGNEPGLAPWMDESLCTYAEVLYYRKYLPQHLQWWWTDYWEGLKPASGAIDRPLWSFTRYFDYRAAVYLKGAQFWEAVHNTLGDEAFIRLLHTYRARYQGRVAPPDSLITLLMEALGPEQWAGLRKAYFSH